jgi:predicted nucleotide-binding protein
LRTYRAPPNERTKGLLRILIADKFTATQIGEIADLLEVPATLISGSNKSERAGSIIRRLPPDKLIELVRMVFEGGFVRPGPTSEANQAAEAELRAACVADTSEAKPAVEPASSGGSDLFSFIPTPFPLPSDGAPAKPSVPTTSAAPPPISPRVVKPEASSEKAVFVVHGHDVGVRESVARLIEKQGLRAIVLQEQPNEGRTVIEKFEKYAGEVEYAIVLLTADDIGASRATPDRLRPRARQNALLELGYFAGRIGRSNVCALLEGDDIELPSDIVGIVYVPLDRGGAWRMTLAKEMKAAGLPVDLNKL